MSTSSSIHHYFPTPFHIYNISLEMCMAASSALPTSRALFEPLFAQTHFCANIINRVQNKIPIASNNTQLLDFGALHSCPYRNVPRSGLAFGWLSATLACSCRAAGLIFLAVVLGRLRCPGFWRAGRFSRMRRFVTWFFGRRDAAILDCFLHGRKCFGEWLFA